LAGEAAEPAFIFSVISIFGNNDDFAGS